MDGAMVTLEAYLHPMVPAWPLGADNNWLPLWRCGESDQRSFNTENCQIWFDARTDIVWCSHEMDWNYSEIFTRNIGLKGFIQIHFTRVTTLTPLQWVDRGRDQGRRGEENQSSIHLMSENRCFVLALWGKPVNMEMKVLTRHLHPMAYPGHHAGVTTDSSAQTEESVRLLIPRIALNYYGQKQRRTNRCHTRMHRMQNSDRCWKMQAWGISIYNNKKPKKQSGKARIDEILPSTQQDDPSSRNKIADEEKRSLEIPAPTINPFSYLTQKSQFLFCQTI